MRWQNILIICSLALGVPGISRAEPTDAEKRAAAQALFDAARRLTAQDKFAEACPKFLESYRLDPAIGTKFYLADCYEHIGRLASAWTYYLEVIEDAHRENAKDRAKFATQRADALKPRVPRLVVKRSAAARSVSGLSVQRDGLPVGEGMWDTPVPVDLGGHDVHVTAPGKKPLDLHVDVKQEGAEVVVEIPGLEAVPAPPPTSDTSEQPPPPPPPEVSPTQRNAGFAVGGIGIAALAVGAGLGGLALSKKNASNANGNCNSADMCTPTGLQLRSDGIHAASGSTALFAIGGVALVVGVVLVATAPSSNKPTSDNAPTARLSLRPLGLSIDGRF
jgi:hypothetical protein